MPDLWNIARMAEKILDEEVARKTGIKNLPLKAGYKAIKKISPDFIFSVILRLAPDFITVLEPFYQKGLEEGDPMHFFTIHRETIAEALLQITDQKSKSTSHAFVRQTYEALRPQAKTHTEEAVPRLVSLMTQYKEQR